MPALLAPDPVWALDGHPPAGLGDLHAPRVAVVLRAHPLLTPARLTTLTEALVSFQRATETTILLVPFQPQRDRPIAEAIAAHLPNVSQIRSYDDPRQCKGLFVGVEFTIGMRLHSLIMAAAEGSRGFALSYDPKVTQLMQELDLPGCELAALPTDANQLCRTWLDCYANQLPLEPAPIESLRDRALLHRELLQQVLLA
ncbi:MAG: hypothetical protein HC910_13085 [Spirulinaceae cyanobacterium SM2_1_0]|nr:hypothetical protein [Spirulinaceae cyanobacterium SM2_1_0]